MREVPLENAEEPKRFRAPVHPSEKRDHVEDARGISERGTRKFFLGDKGAPQPDHGPSFQPTPLPARPCPLGHDAVARGSRQPGTLICPAPGA